MKNIIEILKENFNYTLSLFKTDVIDFIGGYYIIFFNDELKRIEFYSTRDFEFRNNCILNNNSIILKISYTELESITKFIKEYRKDKLFRIGVSLLNKTCDFYIGQKTFYHNDNGNICIKDLLINKG